MRINRSLPSFNTQGGPQRPGDPNPMQQNGRSGGPQRPGDPNPMQQNGRSGGPQRPGDPNGISLMNLYSGESSFES